MKGSEVTDYKGLYNLIVWEHLSSLGFPELCQHLMDSRLTDPRKLAQEANHWVSSRVHKKFYGGHSAKGWQCPQQQKGGDKGKNGEFSKGLQNNSQGKDFQPPVENKKSYFPPGRPGGKGPLTCFVCKQAGHFRGSTKCPTGPRQWAVTQDCQFSSWGGVGPRWVWGTC